MSDRRAWSIAAAFLLAGSLGCRRPERADAAAANRDSVFRGMCDASAAIPLSGEKIAVADDEENVLRVYDAKRGGSSLASVELSGLLGLPTRLRKDGSSTSRELDIEAGARVGNDAYFITSHGRDSRGRFRPERLKFFALSLGPAEQWQPHGAVYDGLLDDLLKEPRLAPYGLSAASELPAKAAGGLNIEGLAVRREGGLWIGFRNPVPGGRALLLPLFNPQAVVLGTPAEFGDPILLDLGGRSVRALAYWRGAYLIAAGAFDGAPRAALFRWTGQSTVQELPAPGLPQYNPEALVAIDERDEILVLSDDGSQLVDGVECKRLRKDTAKSFRGLWLKPGG